MSAFKSEEVAGDSLVQPRLRISCKAVHGRGSANNLLLLSSYELRYIHRRPNWTKDCDIPPAPSLDCHQQVAKRNSGTFAAQNEQHGHVMAQEQLESSSQ
jgi:hypothetical protein